jgi:hypothetical protein
MICFETVVDHVELVFCKEGDLKTLDLASFSVSAISRRQFHRSARCDNVAVHDDRETKLLVLPQYIFLILRLFTFVYY